VPDVARTGETPEFYIPRPARCLSSGRSLVIYISQIFAFNALLARVYSMQYRPDSDLVNALERESYWDGGGTVVRREVKKSGGFLPSDYPEVYRWATDKVGPLRRLVPKSRSHRPAVRRWGLAGYSRTFGRR